MSLRSYLSQMITMSLKTIMMIMIKDYDSNDNSDNIPMMVITIMMKIVMRMKMRMMMRITTVIMITTKIMIRIMTTRIKTMDMIRMIIMIQNMKNTTHFPHCCMTSPFLSLVKAKVKQKILHVCVNHIRLDKLMGHAHTYVSIMVS